MRVRDTLPIVLSFVVSAIAAGPLHSLPAHAASFEPIATFGEVPAGTRILGPVPSRTALRLTFVLRSSAPAPGRVLWVRRHPSIALAMRYAPSATGYERLAKYLAQHGLRVVRSFPDRLVLDVTGTAAQAETALHTRLADYGSGRHRISFGPITQAALPIPDAAETAVVFGLTNAPFAVDAPLPESSRRGMAAGPGLADFAGPAPTENQITVPLIPLATFTVTGPTGVPTGQEARFTVSLRSPDGRPLVGYQIAPLLPAGVQAKYGNDTPGSLVTNASGNASFWLILPSPAATTIAVTAMPPGAQAGAPPVYLTAAGTPLVVSGPVVLFHPLSPAEVNQAYDATPLLTAGQNGHGVGVGIVIWNSFSLVDVAQFFAAEGIPEPEVTVVPVDGGPAPGDGGIEATLDVERAGSTAPGAHITVYDAATSQGVIDALATAIQDGQVNTLSLSWGIAESYLPDSYFSPLQSLFDFAAAEGITVFASSGDAGSRANPALTTPNINWPSDGPAVVSVGGTELAIDQTTGQIASEQAWSPDGTFPLGKRASAAASSTGGFSRYYPRPVWQTAPGLPPVAVEPFRAVPDVSLAATFPGYATFVEGKMQGYGGTSASSPTWAAYLADIESGLHGDAFGGSFLPLLYALYNRPIGTSPFHPITSGSNGDYTAGPGWNPVTGLGTPDVAQLATQVGKALAPATLAFNTNYLTTRVGKTASLAVFVLDPVGLPLANAAVDGSTATPGATVSPATADTGTSGVAVFHLRSQTAGTATYTLSVPVIDGPAISATFHVDWTSPPKTGLGTTPGLRGGSAH